MSVSYKIAVLLDVPLSESEAAAPALFFREFELPFAPSVGLEFNFPGDWFCGPLRRVSWQGGNCFVCWVDSDRHLVDPAIEDWDRLTQAEFFNVLIGRGWRRFGMAGSRPSFFAEPDAP